MADEIFGIDADQEPAESKYSFGAEDRGTDRTSRPSKALDAWAKIVAGASRNGITEKDVISHQRVERPVHAVDFLSSDALTAVDYVRTKYARDFAVKSFDELVKQVYDRELHIMKNHPADDPALRAFDLGLRFAAMVTLLMDRAITERRRVSARTTHHPHLRLDKAVVDFVVRTSK